MLRISIRYQIPFEFCRFSGLRSIIFKIHLSNSGGRMGEPYRGFDIFFRRAMLKRLFYGLDRLVPVAYHTSVARPMIAIPTNVI